MKTIDDKYFSRTVFSVRQIAGNIANAERDLKIAQEDKFPEVKFQYAYSALIKSGIALLSCHQLKVKSVPGHHVKIIDELAMGLKDRSVADIGHVMRSKRNLDMYSGGVEVTSKECAEFIRLAESVVSRVKRLITRTSQNR